jgi:hypothetical protein
LEGITEMASITSHHREQLLRIIHGIRTRWRWKIVFRSLTVLVGAAILTVLAASGALELYRFSPPAIVTFRIVTYLLLVALGWLFLVRPLNRHVTDQQVAMYLEEHEPSLEAALLSAVDVGAPDQPSGQHVQSDALLRRLIESAIEKCQRVDFGRDLERRSMRRSLQVLAGIMTVAALVFTLGPAYLRHGALALLLPVRSAEAAAPYHIEVTPGHTTIPRGADVSVAARLIGFTAAGVDVFTRSGASATFERAPMIPDPAKGRFEATLFSLRAPTDYFVESAGVRSSVFKIDVADLPYVERLELEYVFPAYTGLPPQQIENGGDIAVLRGTTVRARVHPTLPSAAGRIVRNDGGQTALAQSGDGTLGGSFDVTQSGFYRVELQTAGGTLVNASPQYTIDVLNDQPPAVSFSKPGRDLKPSNIEEVLLEAKADDDFGVRQLDLVYSVNGGAERSVHLVGPGGKALREVTATHTFFLEEMNLQPGDVVSYYARATDNDAVQGPKTVSSDMYFLQIRAFQKDYRAAESQAQAQQNANQQGGNRNDPSALSDEQRRIVTATFNVVRDRPKVSADKFREDSVFLTLAESQLRERVEALASQIVTRVGDSNDSMKKVAGWLGDAAKLMRAAEGKLQAIDPKNALPPEQQALSLLQRAEEAYRDVRVTMQQNQQRGGGGGRQSSPSAEDLADLFQLELDRLRNQYETMQRGQQQSADNKVDEMLERLKDLARRQEQEAERQRQMAGNRQRQNAGGGTAAARQRQLADETEQAARQLERLSREQNRADLADAARRMQEAADAMRRAAASGDASAFAQASAAADRLRQARDRLEQQRTDRMAREVQDALARVQKLQEQQRDIKNDVQSLAQAPGNRQQTQRLMDRKDAQGGEVAGVERQLDRTASDFRRERPEASRKVQESADAIRDSRLKEKIRYSKGLVQTAPDAATNFEDQIASDLASLEGRLREAARATSTVERDTRAEALDRARQLVRGVESMDQRLRERQQGQQDQQGQQSQQAQQGQQGQRGQQGERGQQGQQAQDGRQGQQNQGQGGQRDAQAQNRDGRGGGTGDRFGRPPSGFAGGDARPRSLNPDDVRQFQREARERQGEAQALRRDLQALGVEVKDLDDLIRRLRDLDNARAYSDPAGIQQLQSQLAEGFRRFEFDLRRKLDQAGSQLLLSGPDQAPAEYRKAIEEYYRSLARAKKK